MLLTECSTYNKTTRRNVVKLFGHIHVELLDSAPFVQTVELHFPL